MAPQTEKKITSVLKETGLFRHNLGTVVGFPLNPRYHSAVMPTCFRRVFKCASRFPIGVSFPDNDDKFSQIKWN